MTEQTHQTTIGEVRLVALSRISPDPRFNPRTTRDPERFAQLVASVKADGVLQPMLVTPEEEGDGLRLVAGDHHSKIPTHRRRRGIPLTSNEALPPVRRPTAMSGCVRPA